MTNNKSECECDNLKNGSILSTDKNGKCVVCGKQYSKPPVGDSLRNTEGENPLLEKFNNPETIRKAAELGAEDQNKMADSLRKQEEECEHKNISPNVIGLADEVCNDCGSKKYMKNRVPTIEVATKQEEITLEEAEELRKKNESIGYFINPDKTYLCQIMNQWSQEWRTVAKIVSTPKVATSEKECACKDNKYFDFHSAEHCCVINKCYKDSHAVDTPHESSEKECPNCSAKENNWAKHCNECNFIGCYQCIDEHSHTPHESEDWAKEVLARYNAEILNQFQDKYLMERGPGCEEILFPVLTKALEDFINPPNDGMVRHFNLEDFKKSVESKAYQRGREEGSAKKGEAKRVFYMQGYEAGKAKLLSLAVQEIEKEKMVELSVDEESEKQSWANAGYSKGFNAGLDKAKSIISGVMKK